MFFEKAFLMNFIEKHLWGSLFFSKGSRLKVKERLLNRCFLVSFTEYFRTLFLQNTSGWLLLLNILFCSLRWPQRQKNVSFDLGYFKYFRGKHCEPLASSSFWRSLTDSQLWLSWFTAHKAIDMSEILLEIRSSGPAVFCKNEIL